MVRVGINVEYWKIKEREGICSAGLELGKGQGVLGGWMEKGRYRKAGKNSEECRKNKKDDWVFWMISAIGVLNFCSLYCQKVTIKANGQNGSAKLILNLREVLGSNPLLCTWSLVQCLKRCGTVGMCSSTANTSSQKVLWPAPLCGFNRESERKRVCLTFPNYTFCSQHPQLQTSSPSSLEALREDWAQLMAAVIAAMPPPTAICSHR